jgi:hypothetical protein
MSVMRLLVQVTDMQMSCQLGHTFRQIGDSERAL